MIVSNPKPCLLLVLPRESLICAISSSEKFSWLPHQNVVILRVLIAESDAYGSGILSVLQLRVFILGAND